jgi:[acyl-carrier-protein] S-malonyltransferase
MNVFLFPGQGSQEVGMGADLFRSDPAFRNLIAAASQLVGEDLEPTCLRGPAKKLMRPRFLQPLLVAVSLGYLRRLVERGLEPDMVLGHSLGEITALAAAGVVTFIDAVRIAAMRGELMEKSAAKIEGGMMAVTLEDRRALIEWLESPEIPPSVALANDNARTQVVLSGNLATLKAGAEFVAKHKLGTCRFLAVSGPWHSPYMTEAAASFDDWLRTIPFQPPRLPLLFNATAKRAENAQEIRPTISSALTKPVQWTSCMAAVAAMNPHSLFEVGPGRVLSGLARANGFGVTTTVFSVSNLRGVDAAHKGSLPFFPIS